MKVISRRLEDDAKTRRLLQYEIAAGIVRGDTGHARLPIPADDIGIMRHIAMAVGLVSHRDALIGGLLKCRAEVFGRLRAFAYQLQGHHHAVILAERQAVRLNAETLLV